MLTPTRLKVLKHSAGILLSNALGEAQARVMSWAFGEPVWISSSGVVAAYSQLQTQHLRNILKMLRKEGLQDTEQYRMLQEELWSR